jgi:menaquinone-dependent protoporphyrinogen oxidase
MRRVLVTYGSVMGSTAEIAEWIAEELRRADLQVVVCDAGSAPSPEGFQAVVVGSAVYHGRWRPEAVRFLREHRAVLSSRKVWLFQSGPCGGQGRLTRPTPRIRWLAHRLGALGPVVFGGNLDPSRADDRFRRWVTSSSVAADYRDRDEIDSWARGIAARLAPIL